MHDTQSLAFLEQIIRADNSNELPEVFSDFWKSWYQLCREHSYDFYKLLQLLEQFLFQSPDELLSHSLTSSLCQVLRFCQLQVWRNSPTTSPKGKQEQNKVITVSLKLLLQTWEFFLKGFVPRLAEQHCKILIKAMALPYSFSGLAIIKTIDKEALQRQSSISLYSSISTQHNPQENPIEHSSTINLLTAKFQKTVGQLVQAERLLQNLARSLQQSNAIFSSVMFELCDIYSQMEQDELFCQSIRKLLLQNPSHWDFALAGSQFCSQLLQKLPYHIRNQFASDEPVALNWAGLCALAEGEYGPGETLNQEQQKIYWARIYQLKKTISYQKIAGKQNLPNSEVNLAAKYSRSYTGEAEFYSLQRARLLICYILILENLYLTHNSEKSSRVLEENSIIWQNVMVEIYSLSEDIFQRCKNRFS